MQLIFCIKKKKLFQYPIEFTIKLISLLQSYLNAIATFKHQFRQRVRLESVRRQKLKRTQQFCQRTFQLQHSESLTDTIPWSRTEGHMCKWMNLFVVQKSFGPKHLRFREYFLVPLNHIGKYGNKSTGRNCHIS